MMSRPVWRAWALSIFWIGIIFAESYAGSAGNTGRVVYPLLHFLFPQMPHHEQLQIHYLLRKTGHFFGYAILSFTLYRSWWTTFAAAAGGNLGWRDMFRSWDWRAALLALLGTVAMAGFDEFHQGFVPGRGASVADVGLDESGGFLAQYVIVMLSSQAVSRRLRRKAEAQEIISS